MKIIPTPLDGMALIETSRWIDDRGRFERLFCSEALARLGRELNFTQINLSTTARKGTVRGMHFQYPPAAEAKLIRCVRGAVLDVGIDLRFGSDTFLHWHAVELHEELSRELYLPEGFAHGFQTLADDTQLLYFHTAPWTPEHEGGIRHDDPRLRIDWPLPVSAVSTRDLAFSFIDATFTGLHT